MAKPEGKMMAVRLDADEVLLLEKAVKIGAATSTSEAIRIGIRYLPRALADKFLEEDMPKLLRQIDDLKTSLSEVQLKALRPSPAPPIEGVGLDQLIAYAASTDGPLKKAAVEELLRRGHFPDGLGNWPKSEPKMTVRVPAAGLTREDAAPRVAKQRQRGVHNR